MTAEVIILNAAGVALAADSAVTIGGTKIYNTAIKLMSLSKIKPVGIMVYGNAGLMGVPWETLIKVYRQELGVTDFDTLEEYGEDFLNWLRDQTEMFPDELTEQWVRSTVGRYYVSLRQTLLTRIQPLIQRGAGVDSEGVIKAFEELVNQQHERFVARPLVSDMDEKFEKKLRKEYSEVFAQVMLGVFQNLKPKDEIIGKLYDMGVFLLTREIFSRGSSGIVIAGFGEKEIYPSVLSYEMEGILSERIKYRIQKDKSKKVTGGRDAAIYPYAQEDMVNLFMNGIDDRMLAFIQQSFSRLAERIPLLLQDKDINTEDRSADEVRDAFKLSLRASMGSFFQELGDHVRESNIAPVVNMIRVLPKDELAAMAESMINLTAFKRKVTNTLETVGGPIDVAVISKGDGLVWIKRKHYFPKDLNAGFYQNYYRGIDNE